MPGQDDKDTDDVAGPARAAGGSGAAAPEEPSTAAGGQEGDGQDNDDEGALLEEEGPPPEVPPAPGQVSELAAACVRFVGSRYGAMLDFEPDTLSFVDQWIRDARSEIGRRPELVELVQSAAGAYLGEVVRRRFGGEWVAEGTYDGWRVCLSSVYCAFNPIGMAREALSLEPQDGWHAHFELDPAERQAVEDRLAALPEVEASDYYAPSTRFDVVQIVFEALRRSMQQQGLGDVQFHAEDYV